MYCSLKSDDFYPILLLRLVILTKRGWMCVGTMCRQCWHTILTMEFPIGLSCSKISCAICLQSLKRPYSIKLSCYCAGEAAGGHRDWSGQAALLLTLTPFLVNFRGEVSNIGAPLLSDLSSIAQFVSSIYNQVVKIYRGIALYRHYDVVFLIMYHCNAENIQENKHFLSIKLSNKRHNTQRWWL